MNRFCGEIGYSTEFEETAPSVYEAQIVEYEYYGDVVRNSRRLEESSESVNKNISVNNSISVLADDYANEHFHAIRYIRWAGVLWTVTKVTVQSPRLILDLGEVYNGPTA